MKPDYKNWMPKGIVWSGAVLTAVAGIYTLWGTFMYRTFSYDGKRQLSKKIIDTVADYVKLPDGGRGLDVGCGSGALAIACAKRNPNASFVGIDRWGKDYASFSRELCVRNAAAEGVGNTEFFKGDATALEFPDESFDAVVSNYVYHNIPSKDRQAILLESLRTLKKGGTFAIHDIFSKNKYGDMQSFVKKLKDMGYEDVQLISTTNGNPITKFESVWMMLAGSAVLVGKK
ncbi:MAG: methyltransferase domain-containing protein [Clostridiales bacterium]|nr:methyltransferase domain-containing protein [Clostridiales bacterium]